MAPTIKPSAMTTKITSDANVRGAGPLLFRKVNDGGRDDLYPRHQLCRVEAGALDTVPARHGADASSHGLCDVILKPATDREARDSDALNDNLNRSEEHTSELQSLMRISY